ncbi:MAG: ybaK [Micrococcaceae bacterium]|nr:ybaK [Micrococcaceae bacterium]
MKSIKSARTSAGTPALRLLQEANIPHSVHSFEHNPASELPFGLEAAAALGVDDQRVYKTLLADVDGGLVVAILPVAARLDLKALATVAGGRRATMVEPALAEKVTGYVVGGISPLGQRKRLPTFLDESALDHQSMLVSAGRRGLEVELAPADLKALTGASTARVRREA